MAVRYLMAGKKHILITGGTGLVGRHLAAYLYDLGYKVTVLTRNPGKNKPFPSGINMAYWSPEDRSIDASVLSDAVAVIHLAGANVAEKAWTPAYKKLIADSRVSSSNYLAEVLRQYPNQVKVVVSASAIGWYGPDTDGQPFVESAPAHHDFLGETCRLWENSVGQIKALDKRLVILRLGLVLAKNGGAFAELRRPLYFRVAGILGNGKQIFSWIHIHDLCRIFGWAIEREDVQGVFNATAPDPVSSRQFILSMARQLFKSAFIALPVPAFLLRLILGERSVEILKSTTVSSKKIQDQGFEFRYPDIAAAMKNLCV